MNVWFLIGVFSIFQVSSVFPLEQGSTQTEKALSFLHNVTQNPHHYYTTNNQTNNDKSIPKNAILIIVEDSQDKDVWRKFKNNHSFPTEGFLSSCKQPHKLKKNSLSLSDNENCQCEKLLKKNINELITWAQLMKEMNTASISGNNFLLPSFLSNGNPVHDHKKFLINDENKNESTFFHQMPQTKNSWHINETNNQPSLPSFVLNMSSQTNRSNTHDAFWNFISTISQIHSLIFKTIFKVLEQYFSHDQIPTQHKSMLPMGPPKFIDLLSNALMDLELAFNSKGFLLIVVTPADQLSTAYQMIESQVPLNETLMVVTGGCPKEEHAIPYHASGLNPHYFVNTTAVFELPIILKSTLDGCHGICDNKTFSPITSVKDGPKKRKIRSSDDDETQQDDEKAEESDTDSNENEDFSDNEDSRTSDRNSSDLDSARDDSSISHRTSSFFVFKLIFTTVIMIIMY